MTRFPIYPLLQVLEVKNKRVEDAEKVVIEKQEILKREKEKLAQREAERDKVKAHYQDKLTQLRAEFDQGTTSPKIVQMRAYLKIVQEKLVIEEKKVNDQKEQVRIAEANLEAAKKDLQKKRLEVDKLVTHRKDWEKTIKKEMEIIEGREQDELGNTMFTLNERKRIK